MKHISLPLLCTLVLLCACARQPAMETPSPEARAHLEQTWQRYAAADDAVVPAPYRLQLSLRFGTEGDTRRVTALFWGNGQRKLRMDVMAGVGATVANILEDGQHFLVFAPNEHKAYFHQGANKPLLQVGVPVPFNLDHLADLLNGRYAQVFGRDYAEAAVQADGLARYTLEGKPGGSLTLNAQGLPVAWSENAHGAKGWSMEILYTDDASPLPRRLNLTHSNGKRAIVLVKEREKPAQAFTEAQLSLPLPEDVPLLPLSQFKQR
ncbi:lipoprotein insertase outer membrane protein LolB [uncultured Desulfovibrio sp.]|uniref:lipoprotein insertase outer membrane protein LolB n=1 Tax=Desulfovibrio legallii TaxID=571438 RepID=UPI0025952289|nr:lipoprotein insertase outer membrane protein LolB [uncultured Desulfovibrio sp.]